jgi:hypothetical protein
MAQDAFPIVLVVALAAKIEIVALRAVVAIPCASNFTPITDVVFKEIHYFVL